MKSILTLSNPKIIFKYNHININLKDYLLCINYNYFNFKLYFYKYKSFLIKNN